MDDDITYKKIKEAHASFIYIFCSHSKDTTYYIMGACYTLLAKPKKQKSKLVHLLDLDIKCSSASKYQKIYPVPLTMRED